MVKAVMNKVVLMRRYTQLIISCAGFMSPMYTTLRDRVKNEKRVMKSVSPESGNIILKELF